MRTKTTLVILTTLLSVLSAAAFQGERRIYRIGGPIAAPKPLHRENPKYTQEARSAAIEGEVLLSVIIEADGSVSEPKVIRGLNPGLDRHAMEAVRQWRFDPSRKDGSPVPVWAHIALSYRLSQP